MSLLGRSGSASEVLFRHFRPPSRRFVSRMDSRRTRSARSWSRYVSLLAMRESTQCLPQTRIGLTPPPFLVGCAGFCLEDEPAWPGVGIQLLHLALELVSKAKAFLRRGRRLAPADHLDLRVIDHRHAYAVPSGGHRFMLSRNSMLLRVFLSLPSSSSMASTGGTPVSARRSITTRFSSSG